MSKQSCIVIPIYEKTLNKLKTKSLRQAFQIFLSHDIIFICPDSFDDSILDEYKLLNPNIKFIRFADQNFVSVDSYSILLSNPDFYKKFSGYEYMLIYQNDAYVFRDELQYWCEQNFDYIGAPWTRNSNQWFKERIKHKEELDFYPKAGNGGFSLRNITKITALFNKKANIIDAIKVRKILKKSRTAANNKSFFAKRLFDILFFAKFLCAQRNHGDVIAYIVQNEIKIAEDIMFALSFPKIFSEFRVAKAEEAVAFSFESEAEKLYELNSYKLPFGCHAWYKINWEFWNSFIK